MCAFHAQGDAAALLQHVQDWVHERRKLVEAGGPDSMLEMFDSAESAEVALQRACIRVMVLEKTALEMQVAERDVAKRSEQLIREVNCIALMVVLLPYSEPLLLFGESAERARGKPAKTLP